MRIDRSFRQRFKFMRRPRVYPGVRSGASHGKFAGSRALVSYLHGRFLYDEQENFPFSNRGIARTLYDVLAGLGFTVDVVQWNDPVTRPTRHYDLFIGHGGMNFQPLADSLSPDCQKVYFSTGFYWRIHNAREMERFDQLRTRRDIILPYDRYIVHEEEYATRTARAIIGTGGEAATESYKGFPHVSLNENAVYPDPVPRDRSVGSSRGRGFLFFASGGSIHRGLDLVLEAFAGTPFDLYVCQTLDAPFMRAYERELASPNIHYVGWVDYRGKSFYEVMDAATFCISASCAEGSQGAMLECMAKGLIPIATQSTDVDIGDEGFRLDSLNPSEIEEVVADAARTNQKGISDRASSVMQRILKRNSVERFRDDLESALIRALGD